MTQPNDPIIGSSENYPAAEGVDKVIDNLAKTKYLNFDKLNTGFTVIPGRSGFVRGLVLIMANDAPERDPSSYIVEGSDDGSVWTLISQGALNPPTTRYAIDEVRFLNNTSYTQYRVTFPTVRNEAAANSMQVADVQLVNSVDVLTAGDPFTVTYSGDGRSPAGEGPANLFDNQANSKMGVFDGNQGPTTIDVTPGVGASTVTGIDIIGGNDDEGFPGRTPSYVTLFGSNDGVNYVQIYTNTLVQTTADLQGQDFVFPNAVSYTRYRIELGPCTGDTFLQLGEIQLYGEISNAAPANDNCATARPITVGTTGGANFNATGTDTTECGTNDSKDVWFRYVATGNGPVEINTFGPGALDTTLAVYSTCGGAAIACDDNSRGTKSRVTFAATSGQAYLVRVAGANASVGGFTLNVGTAPVAHNDVRVLLAYNFNGMTHNGEAFDPDNLTGYRSIGDRGMKVTGTAGSLDVGLESGSSGIGYSVVTTASTLDIVHLGNRNVTDGGNWTFSAEPDGDRVGVQPSWLIDSDQTVPQTTSVAGLGLAMGADTKIGVLYNASNGGSIFTMKLTFGDGTEALLPLTAPDWYGAQNPGEAQAGVESQTSLGTFLATENVDEARDGVDLNVVEAVASTASLLAAGVDVSGKTLSSISFQDPLEPNSAIAIYAVTVRDGTPTCRADFNADGFVDFFDFNDFVDCFEAVACPEGKTADFDNDGFIDFFDFTAFVDAFDLGC